MIWVVPTNYSLARASMGSLIEGKVLVHYSSKKSGQTKYVLTNRMYSTVQLYIVKCTHKLQSGQSKYRLTNRRYSTVQLYIK